MLFYLLKDSSSFFHFLHFASFDKRALKEKEKEKTFLQYRTYRIQHTPKEVNFSFVFNTNPPIHHSFITFSLYFSPLL